MIRKIKTQEEAEKAKKRKQFIIGGILMVIIVISTLGYSLTSNTNQSNSKKEKGITFSREEGLWKTKIGGSVFGFQYLPSEVEEIPVEISFNKELYTNKPLYFVNPNEAINEVLTNIGQLVLRYQEACVEESSCKSNQPLKDCSNNIIIFKPEEETKVYQDENCIYIGGEPIKSTDAFLYKLLDIS